MKGRVMQLLSLGIPNRSLRVVAWLIACASLSLAAAVAGFIGFMCLGVLYAGTVLGVVADERGRLP